MSIEDNEPYPISDFLEVIEGEDIYKSPKWWKAILTTQSQYGKQTSIYLWTWDSKNEKWKRKQKASAKNLEEWDKIDRAMRSQLGKVEGK